MTISVIIPAYNAEKYISTAIKSVLEQTYQDFEIIVIDDGSTDNTRNIVKSFEDPRITYLNQINSGPAIARNRGINVAKGDYIAFLDADDIWKPEKLEIQMDMIEKQPETYMVYSAFTCNYEDKNETETVHFNDYNREEFLYNLLLNPFKTIPYPSTVLIKKSELNRVGRFNPFLYLGEDWDLWLRLAPKGECRYIDNPLTTRYIPKTSITKSINAEKQEYYHSRILQSFFDNNPQYENLKLKSYSIIFFNLATLCFYRNNKMPTKEVYRYIFTACRLYPGIIFNGIKNTKFILNVLYRSIIPPAKLENSMET